MNLRSLEHKPLGDIASIVTGATVSYYSKTQLEGEDQAHLITGASITQSGSIDPTRLANVWLLKEGYQKFLAEPGDVLLLTRGNFRAVYVDSDAEDRDLLVSANFAIIRPRLDYQPKALKELLSIPQVLDGLTTATSSNLSIRTRELKTLQIPMLPVEVQQRIVDISEARDAAYASTLALAEAQLDAANARIGAIIGG